MSRPKKNPNILPIPIDQSSPDIETTKRDSREDRFIELVFQGMDINRAALMAGYSETYSAGFVHSKFKSPAFQDKMRDYAYSHNAKSVPKVLHLYSKTVDLLNDQVASGNLDQLAKLKHIPRDILTIAKILVPEQHAGTVNYVNVENMQAIINGKFDKSKGESDT